MPRALRIRLAAGAMTAAIVWLYHGSGSSFLWCAYSVGFAHYLLALYYASAQLRAAAHAGPQLLSVAGLGVLSLFLYQIDFPLVVYFGLHHALNEAYGRGRSTDTARLAAAAAVFQGVAYATVLRFVPQFAGVDQIWIWAAFTLAGLWFAVELYQTRALRFDLCAPEIATAMLVVISLFVQPTFVQFVLYHFMLWVLLPVERLSARGENAVLRYAALSIVVTGLCLLVSPIGPPALRLPIAWFNEQFLFWSYAHITLSFALSDAHPAWLVRLFRAGPAPRLAAPRVAG